MAELFFWLFVAGLAIFLISLMSEIKRKMSIIIIVIPLTIASWIAYMVYSTKQSNSISYPPTQTTIQQPMSPQKMPNVEYPE
jgi:formate hydrogenlyase subunit 3/multisubunit Na+/H+ antiporter MnhD subunit